MEAVSKIPNNLLMDFFIHNPSFVKIYHLVFKEVAVGRTIVILCSIWQNAHLAYSVKSFVLRHYLDPKLKKEQMWMNPHLLPVQPFPLSI